MYILVSKIIKQKNPNKESTDRKWRKSYHISMRSKLQNLIGRISVSPFRKQPFADVFQSKSLKVMQYSQENKSVFLGILCNFMNSFFSQNTSSGHLCPLPVPFEVNTEKTFKLFCLL